MSENVGIFLIIGIAILAFFIIRKILSYFKVPKVGCLALVTGGVKAGKSTLAIYLAIKQYKRAVRSWKLRSFFQRVFGKKQDEQPLFYSNIPVRFSYVELTKDMLMRKVRFRYGSVVYINEASLIADSWLTDDKERNERLNLFFKLFGHETGGYMVLDTHCIGDCHYSLKRCTSEYFYIHHLVKWIPFFLVGYVREDRYSDDGTMVSVNDKDVEESLKRVIIPRRIWKQFDSRCFSSLTDDCPVGDKVVSLPKNSSLKVKKVVSFRDFVSIPDSFKDNGTIKKTGGVFSAKTYNKSSK